MSKNNWDAYEPDPIDEIRQNLDDAEAYGKYVAERVEEELKQTDQERGEDLKFKCQQLVPDILAGIANIAGISQEDFHSHYQYSDDLNEEKLVILNDQIAPKIRYDEYGAEICADPLERWTPKSIDLYSIKSKDVYSIIFEAGYEIGRKNELEGYWMLLSDLNFSRGFFLGKLKSDFEKHSNESWQPDNSIREEMASLRPEAALDDWGKMVSAISNGDDLSIENLGFDDVKPPHHSK